MMQSVSMVMDSWRRDEPSIRLWAGRPVVPLELFSVRDSQSLRLGGHGSQYLYTAGRLGVQVFGKSRGYIF